MKALCAIAAVGLSLVGFVGFASAQPYGGRDYGYEERGPRYRDRDRGYGFDEGEYLRCNPDVLRAVRRGQMESGAVHYQTFGRHERRRLSC